MENEESKKKEINIGLCLLRMLMCFEVVLAHFWTRTNTPKLLKPFEILCGLAVPVFMFMSFYLVENRFVQKKKEIMQRRIWKLCVPQIGWAIIYYIIFKVVSCFFELNTNWTIQDLIWQIFTGHSSKLNATMWYQIDLIFLTLIFFIFFYFFTEKKGVVIIFAMMFFALVFQYSGINTNLFDGLRYELKYPLGRFCEMIPYATLGFCFAFFKIFDKLKKARIETLVFAILFCLFFIKYNVFSGVAGFGYQGIRSIVLAVLVFTVAYFFPFDKIPKIAKDIIYKISRFTLGIYCMHRLVATLLNGFLSKIIKCEINSFLVCILTYIISYFISYIIYKIPLKICKDLVN